MEIWIVSLIIVVMLILLVTEKIPVDLTSIGLMVALVATRILTPQEAVDGLSNPAVITVGSMFLLSRGLIRTGAVGYIAQKVILLSKGKSNLAVMVVLLTVAISSAFINNTPVVVLFIPIVLSLSCKYHFSPSKFLIPVSYASILAGTCTLIGTSTNIIVSDLSIAYGYAGIGMFELAAIGVPIAVLGLSFLYFGSGYLMPAHAAPTCELEDRENRRYLAEFRVPENSPLIGQNPTIFLSEQYDTFEVFEVIRASHVLYPDEQDLAVEPRDLLLVKGSASDIVNLLNSGTVQLPGSFSENGPPSFDKDALFVELIIPPQSFFIGNRLVDMPVMRDPEIRVIAIRRRRIHYAKQKLRDLKVRVGDIILIQCTRDRLDRIRTDADMIVVEDVHHEIIVREKAPIAVAVFGGVVAAATAGLADIMVCAMAGVFLMILTRCLHLRDAYKSLRADVLLLIAGTIALGAAMEKSGASRLYAQSFLSLFANAGPQVVLSAFILITSVGTLVLSNNATAVLFLPIGISTALSLGVDPRPFIIGICFGASACFASPIGYQTNLMVYGPGGYRFTDYLKLGIPLNFLVIAMASWLIPVLYKF